MTQVLWILGGAIWLAWTVQAVLSVMLVRKFARGFDRPRRAGHEWYRPHAAVIVPFKGADDDLPANLRGLFTQDYPSYRLVLVVESETDPAFPVLQQTAAAHPHVPCDILVAGQAPDDTGQKVHNLLTALDHLEASNYGEEAWAFADSDAVPHASWLASLVGPLGQSDRTAVTTGYRWFVPTDASAPSRFASVINSSVACWAGRDEYNRAWGGSMAMKTETARRGKLRELWRGALSDDYQVSRMCRQLGRRVYFVHKCLVAAPASFTWRSLFEFGRRQYVITKTHEPLLYAGALFLTTLYVAGLVATCASLAWLIQNEPRRYVWIAPLIACCVNGFCYALRASYRRQAVRKAFPAETAAQLRPVLSREDFATPLYMFIHWLIVLSALVGRTITWRGKRYRIDGPQRIRRLA